MTYVANFQGSVWRAKSVRVDLFSGTVPETGVTRASIFLAHSPFNLPTSLLFQSSIRQFSRLPLVGADDVIAGCVCICVCGVSFISFYMRGWWRLFLLFFIISFFMNNIAESFWKNRACGGKKVMNVGKYLELCGRSNEVISIFLTYLVAGP